MERGDSYLRLLLDVTQALTSTLDLDRLFRLIVERVPAVFGVDAATLRLIDPGSGRLVLRAAHGLSEEYLRRGPVDREPSVLEALEGRPIAVEDATSDPRIAYHEAARAEGVRSLIAAPIPIRGKAAGVLRLLSRTPRRFTDEELEFAGGLAGQCGVAIENARAFTELERQLGYFKAVGEIARAIHSAERLEEIVQRIVRRLPEVMGLKACTIRLFDPREGRLDLKAAHGLSRAYLERGGLDDEPATHYLLQGEPVVIPDATADVHTRYHEEAAREGIRGILAVPIAAGEETLGILRLLSAEVRYFSEHDIQFALAVADQAGIAVNNALGRGAGR